MKSNLIQNHLFLKYGIIFIVFKKLLLSTLNSTIFILLPINKWDNEYHRANIGGISCDASDYYNSEDLNQEILLPKYSDNDKEPLYLGFFHTGAYQDSISGYGGIKHCLIPSPKHIIIDRDEKGNFIDYVYREEQSADEMFNILGYNK